MVSILETWSSERPDLFGIESIGRSHEGRDIWLATVTSRASGPAAEKPAIWIDANIHATEVASSTAVLYLVDSLLRAYGSDPKVTRLLDTRAFLLVPRLNPDGAELALGRPPRFVRSSTRPYPRTDVTDGLHPEDIDGDGRILVMRIPDSNGAWKADSQDPRLLVPREPDEEPGGVQFYRVLPEGRIRNYDGVTIARAAPRETLDLNRNFPMDWRVDSERPGAGPFPVSEPEVRAMVEAIVARPNICAAIHCHTYSGLYLRPYSGHPDSRFPASDLRTYGLLGDWATRLTGYPASSVFHGFSPANGQASTVGADDWLYDHWGVLAWTLELWDPLRAAGVVPWHPVEWFVDHPVEDDRKLLEWNDRDLGGQGFVDWHRFDHPQLGPVELGGWDMMYCWANPPPDLLEPEVAPHAAFAKFLLAVSPHLEVRSLEVDRLADRMYRLRLVLQNTGWLPTNVTQQAIERGVVLPIDVELSLPEDAQLVGGSLRVEAGQIEGRALKRNIYWAGADDGTTDRVKLEWVIEAPRGGTITIEARHQRAGTVRASAELR